MNRTARPWRIPALWMLAAALLPAPGSAAPKTGSQAPPIFGTSLSGGPPLALSQFRGQVVYVDFWATWCGPCRVSLPLLAGLRQELAPRGFEVLGVNVDREPATALQYAKDAGVAYPVVRGVPEATLEAYDLGGMPMAYLIDRQGRVRSLHTGFRASELPALKKEIEALLEEKAP